MRVLFAGGGTGGHLVPALVLADALCNQRPEVEPVFVGATRGIEAKLLPDRTPPYRFHLLDMEPVYRRQWWRNVRWLWLGRRLYRSCKRIVQVERPALVVGTGGYVSGPVVFAAHRAKVPVVLQEQNAFPGLATRILSRYAREIFVGFSESTKYLDKHGARIILTGNPVASPGPDAGDESLELPEDAPTCLVMGGSQGALRINEAVSRAIDSGLLDGVCLLWSTGMATFERYRHHHQPPWRHVRAFWNPISAAYRSANVVVSRAGAMSVAELQVWGLPSILIPLPTAAGDHQTANAKALEARGAALHLAERDLDSETLVTRLRTLLTDKVRLHSMSQAAKSGANPGATEAIVSRITQLLDAESLS